MTIYSNDNIESRAPRGLDAKMYVGSGSSFLYDSKEDIPSEYRFQGMIVYEVVDSISMDIIYPVWQLKGGITDNHWVQINTSAGGGTQGLIQIGTWKTKTSGYVSSYILPGGFHLANSQVYLNGILVTNDENIKPETFYSLVNSITYSTLDFVEAPENGTSIYVVKQDLYLT